MFRDESVGGSSAWRWVVAAVAVGALLLTALRLADATAVVLDSGLTPSRLYRLLMSVGSVTAAVLALWLVRSGWSVQGVPLLAVFMSTFGVGLAVEGSVRVLAFPSVSFSDAFDMELLALNVVTMLATVLGVFWFQRFPSHLSAVDLLPTRPTRLARLSAWWLRWLLPPWRVWLVFGAIHLLLSNAWLIGVSPDPTSVRLTVTIFAGLTGIGYLRRHWSRSADPDQIRRAGWVIEAIVIALVLAGFASVFEVQLHVLRRSTPWVVWPHAVLLPLALISFVASLGVSVLYRGAIAPSLVIARTTVLGGVGLFLTCLFLVGEELLSNLVVEWFGLPSLVGSVGTGLLAGAAFAPLYRWANTLLRRDAARSSSS